MASTYPSRTINFPGLKTKSEKQGDWKRKDHSKIGTLIHRKEIIEDV